MKNPVQVDVNLCAMLRLAFEQKANYNVNEPDQTILRSKKNLVLKYENLTALHRDDWAMCNVKTSRV